MFKSHELVVQMQKKPKYNRPSKDDTTPAEMSKPPIPFRDPMMDLRMLVEENLPRVFVGLIAYKAATTALRAAEHIVVTKVK